MKELKYSILINKASKQFGERGFECILAVVLGLGVLSVCMLMLPFGVALTFLIAPFLCLGIKKYLLAIAQNQFVPVETILLEYKSFLRAFCLKVAYTLVSVLWGIIFIIPGIISALNYSMATFIMAENNNLSSLECMVKSKKLVSGFRAQIFIIYLSYFFVSVASMCILASVGLAIKTFTQIPLWSVLVMSVVTFLFVLVIFIIPYFELALTNVYLELKNKDKTKTKQTQNIKNDIKSDLAKPAQSKTRTAKNA